MERRFKVPLWVELVYHILGFLDYKVVSPVSSSLMCWRNGLLDRYCRCEQCLERKRTGTL
jgi:hypothetical protein